MRSQEACYQRLASELRQAVQFALRNGSKRLLGTYLQALLAYPDACTRSETVVDPVSGKVLAHAPAMPADRRYPKEQVLVERVQRERSRGRRVLCYVTHTDLRDLTPRLQEVLGRAGLRAAVLKASTVPPERREEWIARRAAEGIDVLLTNPRLVQTGLDLLEWPTLLWYEPEFSLYVMRQASRRSWRPGQRLPVGVPVLAYANTMQARALALVAAKLRSALLVEGELPEGGLPALEGDEHDTLVALARHLVEEDTSIAGGAGGAALDEARSLEALFAAARREELEGDQFLVAQPWEPLEAIDTGLTPPLVPAPSPLIAPAGLGFPPTAWTGGSPGPAVWQTMLALGEGAEEAAPGATPMTPPATVDGPGRLLSFEELARLVQRPRRRPRRLPDGQLALLSA